MNSVAWKSGVAMLALSAGAAFGQADKSAPKPMQSFLVVEMAPFSEMFQDPKDAALKNALAMFPARLRELPSEIPDMPPEIVPLTESIARCFTRPGRFAVTYTPNYMAGGAIGYGIMLSSRFGKQADADAFESQIMGMIKQADPEFEPTESTTFPSLTEVVIPVAPIRFGSRVGRHGPSYDIIWGAVTDADAPFEAMPKPTLGGKNLINGTLDMQALGALVNVAQTGINGAMQAVEQRPLNLGRELAAWGLIGSESLKIHFESAYVDGAVRSKAVMENAQKLMEQLGTDKGGLSAADLAAIPADATSASMSLVSTKPLLKLLNAVKGRVPQAQEALDQFTGMTGVDLENDLLASIGGVMGFYTSESTGGGGAGSMVTLVSFVDRAKFLAAHDKLAAAAREMMNNGPEELAIASKYIRLRTWKSGSTDVLSLTFPGVPVPLEISYAATDRWFVLGLTPQAVVGALAQLEGKGDRGIATRAEVAAFMPKGKEITSLSFTDTARSVRDGYTVTTMFGSAVANAMRSPSDPSREPGILVPSYKDLVKGVRAKVNVSYREGETIVVQGISDGSMLVGMASAMGDIGMGSTLLQMGMIGVGEKMKQGGMNFGEVPVPNRIAAVLRGMASGPTVVLSPEQLVLLTGAVMPENLSAR
jgi:hypothetical protein